MMRITIYISSIILLIGISHHSDLLAKERKSSKRNNDVRGINVVRYSTLLAVNEIRAFVSNEARLLAQTTSAPGLEWPRGSGNFAVYLMSPWLACQYEGDTANIRTAAVQNSGPAGTEFIPGKIIQNPDGTIRPDDPTSNRYRLYTIKSGDDANSNPDYRDWPFEDGAPYVALLNYNKSADSLNEFNRPIAIDVDGNQLSLTSDADLLANKARLVPKLFGALTQWCVYNDLKASPRSYSPQGIGAEIQQTAFAFATSGARGRTVFFKFKIINKNVPSTSIPNKGLWKNTYFAIFNDNDLGDAPDDLVGVDTLQSIAYTYNASNSDANYGSAPPAVGVDYFQGPYKRNESLPGRPKIKKTDTKSPKFGQDSTFIATAHVRFNNGGGEEGDPEGGRPDQVYNFLQGLSKSGNPLGFTEAGSKFMFPGDPQSASGIVESIQDDKRQLIVSGPFEVYPGDVEDIVIGVLVSKGSTNLNSVTNLKKDGTATQAAYDANFQVPSAPAPKISVSELSNEVILSWVDNNPRSASYTYAIENVTLPRPGAVVDTTQPTDEYVFEGYNVYQWSTLSGKGGQGATFKKVATFDVVNNVTEVIDGAKVIFNGSEQDVVTVVQTGTNSGITRSLRLKEDLLASVAGAPLINGQRYYYTVTTYYVNPFLLSKSPYPANGVVPREEAATIESLQSIVTAVPKNQLLGTVLPNAVGDLLITDRNKLAGDDNVRVKVVDPTALKKSSFKVKISDAAGTKWELRDATSDTLIVLPTDTARLRNLTVITNKVDSAAAPIVNGVQILVGQNPLGLRLDSQGGRSALEYLPFSNRFFFSKAATGSYTATGSGPSATAFNTQSANFGIGSANGSVYYPSSNFFTAGLNSGTTVKPESLKVVEIEFTNDESKKQFAYRYVVNLRAIGSGANAVAAYADPSFIPFIDTSANKAVRFTAEGTFQTNVLGIVKVPLRAFEVNPVSGERLRQLNVLFTERNDSAKYGGAVDGKWSPNSSQSGGQELLLIAASTYDTSLALYKGTATVPRRLFLDAQFRTLDIQYILWVRRDGNKDFSEGDKIKITPNFKLSPSTDYTVNVEGIKRNDKQAGENGLAKVNVFPNPYYGSSKREKKLRETYVTFNNLPETCKIRIFTLSGELVRTINRTNSTDPLQDWDLRNFANIPVASGVYLVHIETAFGSKVLKLALIQREEREDLF